ncbi:MAG TPA: hypothetical protein PLD31_04665 [Streptococcus parasuis]|nr:hypothetical protein [Streptococcus parasuis]
MKDLFLKSQQDFLFGNLSQLDLGKFNEVLETLETQQMREEQVGRLLSTFQNNVLILNFGSSMPDLGLLFGFNNILRIHAYPVLQDNLNTLCVDFYLANGIVRVKSWMCAYKDIRLQELIANFVLPIYEFDYESKTYITHNANDTISSDDRVSEFQNATSLTMRITRVLDSTYDMAEIENLMATC